MRKKKVIFCLLFVLETIIAACLLANIMIQDRNAVWIETSLSDWKSEYIEYKNGWHVDEAVLKTDNMVTLIYGPYMKLCRGSYQVTVVYECDQNQSFLASTDSTSRLSLKSEAVILSKNKTSVSWRFSLLQDAENFEISFQYNGKGNFSIKDIKIQTDSAASCRMFVAFVLLSVIVDTCFCLRRKIIKNKKLLFSFAVITLLVSMPLFVARGIGYGHDLYFHLMRMEGIVQELRNGNVLSRMPSLWMEGYGYPVSVYYGDLLLYVPALLRIAGFSMTTAYKIYLFVINLGTVIISYLCFQRIFIPCGVNISGHSERQQRQIALLLSLVYVTSSYRIVNLYVRAAVGEYSAMMFFPIITLAVYRIYTQDSRQWKTYRRNSLLLAVGMTGVIGTHILSTEMVIVTLAVLCAVFWKKTFQRNTLKAYMLAVLETIVLNLYFIIPFADYFLNVKVKVNIQDIVQIQHNGAYVQQYLLFFQNIYGMCVEQLSERLALTPGMVLISVLFVAVWMWGRKKASQQVKVLTMFSAGILFLASNWFPWNYLAEHFKLGVLLCEVQFPWRYLGIANLFLTLLLGTLLQFFVRDLIAAGKKKPFKLWSVWIIGGCVLTMCFSTLCYKVNAIRGGIGHYGDTAELDTCVAISLGEYLRKGTDINALTNEVLSEHMLETTMLSRDGMHMEIYCKAAAAKEGSVEVPMLNYKGYHVSDEYGNLYSIEDGNNNRIRFTVPSGFSGVITIDFVEPWYWRIGDMTSLAAVIFLLFIGVLHYVSGHGKFYKKA